MTVSTSVIVIVHSKLFRINLPKWIPRPIHTSTPRQALENLVRWHCHTGTASLLRQTRSYPVIGQFTPRNSRLVCFASAQDPVPLWVDSPHRQYDLSAASPSGI